MDDENEEERNAAEEEIAAVDPPEMYDAGSIDGDPFDRPEVPPIPPG